MLPEHHGSIINVSSAYGKVGAGGASVYVASKHAVEGMTKSAAIEFGTSGVRINAVAPGPVVTGMLQRFTGGEEGMAHIAQDVPMKRNGTVDEIAEAILFVASDKASFITGQSFSVDGGRTAI